MMRLLVKYITITLVIVAAVHAFHEDSVFEDEDIYSQGLPPVPHTGITAPGTKWCGPGNTAANYSDLGKKYKTDMCCRAHDHCEEILEPRQVLHGLTNPDWFPILKCTCEQVFINCLQQVNNMMANTLGRVYFGTQNQCFANGYPIVSCKEYQKGTFRKRCVRYHVDKQHPKIWQFYDIPFYSYKMDATQQGE